jgi:hypothetical protein
MPTLLLWHGYRFRFYSSDRPEPAHVHVQKDGCDAKVWLHNLEISFNHGYNDREMQKLVAIVAEHRDSWIGSWNDFFGI